MKNKPFLAIVTIMVAALFLIGAGGNNRRFANLDNGTVRDNKTGLIWLKNASCSDLPGTDINGKADRDTAIAAAAALSDGTCGLTDGSAAGDWRLPTKEEWEAFCSLVYDNPALVNTVGDAKWSEGDAFIGVQSSDYWSSTDYNSVYACCAHMHFGAGYVVDYIV